MPPGQDPSVVISPCPGVRQNSIRHPRGGRWRPRNGVYSARNHINPPTPTADFHLNSAGSPMTNFNPPRGPKRSSECVECEPPNHCNKRQKPAKRSPEQVDEAAFIEYMETYLRRGFSVKGSHVLSHLKVYRKRVQSPKKPVGKDWDSGFFERYPKAQQWHLPRSGKTTPNDRTIDHDTAALCNILDELAGLVKSKKIPRDKIYFALNTGYMVSGSRGITPAIKRPQRPGDVRREAPSVVYAFSSTGQAIDPYFIFQSNEQTGHAEIKTSQGRQLWAYYSETEWADDSSLMDWFFRVFHPQTKGSGNDNANFLNRIIVLEEERFPVTKELYASCWAKNVYLISIPRTTPGRIILKVFEDLMQGSRFGEPYDTFAKKNMKRDDKMFSVSNEKLIDFIYGQTRQPDLGTFVREAWRESYLMPTRSKDFLQFVEMRKPTPRHPRATPLLQNPRNISAQHAISPTSDMSTPTIVPARNRGRSPPPGIKSPRMLRSSNRHAYQTPLSPGHDRVDDYIYHEPDWTDNVRRPSFHEDQEDEEPELPRSRAASFDDREGSEWTPSRPPRSKWTRSRARSRGGRATSTPDRTKLREFYDQLERIRALSDSLLSEPWMNFDGE